MIHVPVRSSHSLSFCIASTASGVAATPCANSLRPTATPAIGIATAPATPAASPCAKPSRRPRARRSPARATSVAAAAEHADAHRLDEPPRALARVLRAGLLVLPSPIAERSMLSAPSSSGPFAFESSLDARRPSPRHLLCAIWFHASPPDRLVS